MALIFPDDLFALIVLVIFAGACFRDLRYGIYLIIFSMPAYLWRTEIFSIPTTLLELMIYILFLMWLAGKISIFSKNLSSSFFFQKGKISVSQFMIRNSRLVIGIVLLFLGLAISTALSDNLRVSLGIMKGWFVDPFLFFLVLVSTVKTKKQITDLFSVWALSGLMVAITSLFYLTTSELTYDGRLKSFFLSPNYLAMYLSPAFLIVLFLLLDKLVETENWKLGNWKIGRFLDNISQVSSFKFQVLILIIIFIPLYFTYSYGAFLGIAAATVYLVILFLKRDWGRIRKFHNLSPDSSEWGIVNGKSVNFTVIILCLFILSLFLFLSADKFQQIINSNNRSSFHSRLMIWNTSREILKDNFIFGIGPGTFQKVYLDYADKFSEPYLEWAVPQPHNIFLAFWLQVGMIGLTGFVLILIWFFDGVLKYKSATYNSQLIIPITLMIYLLVHGLVDTTYWKNDLSLMFWILIGVAIVSRGDIQE